MRSSTDAEAEVERYLYQRLATTTLPAMVTRQIWQRTDGNALFVVHMVEYLLRHKSLVFEAGQWQVRGDISTSAIPETLPHLLEKQVAEMPVEQQRLLEVASVVGGVFTVESVAAGLQTTQEAVEDGCEGLVRQDVFLEDCGVTIWPDGTLTGQYRFRHALYREALYQRVGSARRTRLHRVIGLREEAGYGEHVGKHAAELAQHFVQGQDATRTIHYLCTAGQNALRNAAPVEAERLFSHALTLVGLLADSPQRRRQELEVQLGLVTALILSKGFVALEVEAVLVRAQALCQQLGETPDLLPLLASLWIFSFARGELPTAREVAERALRLAHHTADPAWLGAAQSNLQMTLYFQGELTLARQYGDHALAQIAGTPSAPLFSIQSFNPRVRAQGTLASVQSQLGYLDQAVRQGQAALRRAREVEPPQGIAMILFLVSCIYGTRREWEHMQAHAAELLTLATDHDFPFWRMTGTRLQRVALLQQGTLTEGLEQTPQDLTLFRARSATVAITRPLSWLVEVYARTGQIEAGFAALEEAFAAVEQRDERFWEAELYRLRGELTLRMGERKTGRTGEEEKVAHSSPEACFLKAITIARRQEAKVFELRAACSLARLWR